MKKILLFLLVFSSYALSDINECKTDVYFGNGILTKDSQAESNAKLLRTSVIEKFGLDYYTKHIGEVSYAHNDTFGFGQDIFESGFQIINIQGYIDWWARQLSG